VRDHGRLLTSNAQGRIIEVRKDGVLVASYAWDQNSNRVAYDDERGLAALR
jgi:YD repeat-containing protein